MAKDKRPPSSNYRKPPVEHQFKKGQSGHPEGRPKKKATPANFGALGGGIVDRFVSMALDEATRLVTVPEGKKTSKIPAMQALIRTMFTAAAQGDTKAGRQLLDVIARVESARTADAQEFVGYMAWYKEHHGAILEECQRKGEDPPDIYPHPDDIIIDQATGTVTIDGPTTKDEAGARKAVREQAITSLGRYFQVEAALEKEPGNLELEREFKELKRHHDFLTDFLKKNAVRNARHEAARIARRALQKPESEDDVPDQ